MATLFALENSIKNYAWGSRVALATIRRKGSAEVPEAELWMGAHPLAPSRALTAQGIRPLPELIAADPSAMLGERVASEFRTLPFLLKLLAAAEPLSLQAHPSAEQAREGFAREEAARVPRDAPTRNYKDDQHKPELIAALTPFTALVGFREPRRTLRLFESIATPALAPVIAALSLPEPADALRACFDLVTGADGPLRRELAGAALAACRAAVRSAGAGGEFSRELAWGVRIGELYPGDPGIVLALALNLVVLEPGQALYLPARKLHAYLEGTGVEIMASSDNVLRGGLTPKHVDSSELARVLDFQPDVVRPAPTERVGHELHYRAPAREFALSRFELAGERAEVADVRGPEILVVTQGAIELERAPQRLPLEAGASVFVPAAGGGYSLTGAGTVFRARVQTPEAKP
jgi:mannose-6-phosphate isomerase